jgi:ParB family chromosome partitioning protein
MQIACQDIKPDSHQPRKWFAEAELSQLAESLRVHGQLVPVIVQKTPTGYTLVDGERRWRAASLAGLAMLNAILVDKQPEPSELKLFQLTVNSQRSDLSPLEKAKVFQELMELKGWNASQLAKAVFVSNSTVTMLLSLLKLAPAVQQLVESGKLELSKAYYLARIEDSAEQERLAMQAVETHLSREQLVGIARHPKRIVFKLKDQVLVSITGNDLSLEQIVRVINELGRHAKRALSQGVSAMTLAHQLTDQSQVAQ